MIALKLAIILAAWVVLQAIWLAAINAEAKQDYRDILKDGSKDSLGKKWHQQSFLKILGLGLGMTLPFFYFGWQAGFSLLLLMGAEFALLFDRKLNKARGLTRDYVGQNASIDKFFRRLFQKEPGRAMLVAKIILIVLSGLAYLYFTGRWFGFV